MYRKTRGLVLRVLPFSDKQRILKMFTEELGVQSFLIGSSKNKHQAVLYQPLQLLNMVVKPGADSLGRVKEAQAEYIYKSINLHPLKRLVGMLLSEIYYNVLQHQPEDEELFSTIRSALIDLDNQETLSPDFHLLHLLDLSGQLGFIPENNYSETCCFFDAENGLFTSSVSNVHGVQTNRHLCYLFHQLLNKHALPDEELNLSRSERKQLLELILKLYHYHTPNFKELKSLEVIYELAE
jgi:DNA repair protein RecO (recombination protein O)